MKKFSLTTGLFEISPVSSIHSHKQIYTKIFDYELAKSLLKMEAGTTYGKWNFKCRITL